MVPMGDPLWCPVGPTKVRKLGTAYAETGERLPLQVFLRSSGAHNKNPKIIVKLEMNQQAGAWE